MTLRLTKKEQDALKELAKAKGISMQDAARHAIQDLITSDRSEKATKVRRELKLLQSAKRPEKEDVERVGKAYAELSLKPPAIICDVEAIATFYQPRRSRHEENRSALKQAVLDRITELLDDSWTLRDLFDTYKAALWFSWRGCFASSADFEVDWQNWKEHEPSLDEFLEMDIPADRLDGYARAQWKAHQDGFIHGRPIPSFVVEMLENATRIALQSRDREADPLIP